MRVAAGSMWMWIGALVLLAGLPVAGAQAASFRGLGDLSGGEFWSKAYGVSADGRYVVGDSRVTDSMTPNRHSDALRAFRYDVATGEMSALEPVSFPGIPKVSQARSVAVDGSVAGWESSLFEDFEVVHQGVRWDGSGAATALGRPTFSGAGSGGIDITPDGSAIAGWFGGDGPGSFDDVFASLGDLVPGRWDASAGFRDLPSEVRGFGHAAAISADGTVFAVNSDRNFETPESYAQRWSEAGGVEQLGELPLAFATGMSDDGARIVGGQYTTADPRAWLWDPVLGMRVLAELPKTKTSVARAISGDGRTIVGDATYRPGTQARPFYWRDGKGMRHLDEVLESFGIDLTGWDLQSVQDVSRNGRHIVGYGVNPAGETEAFLATIPEPSTGALLASGLVVLGRRQRAPRR